MADVLSQSEVESLLAALDPEETPAAVAPAPQAPHSFMSAGQQINIYDFKRPERVSKEQMRVMHALHEGFSREFGAGLSGMLRTIVEVKLISVDQLTYSEFVFSLENPTCFNLIWSSGLDGHIILDLTMSIVFPIVDRLLGGGKHLRTANPKRGLTEIEVKLVSRITDLALSGLEKAWANICELGLKVSQIESNPQLIQIVPPNEVVVLVSFELIMGDDIRGIMNLCIPYNSIEPFSGRLASDTWSSYSKRSEDPVQRINLELGVAKAPVDIVVLLAETKLTTKEVRNLEVGDVLLTDHQKKHGLKVFVEDQPLFEGFPGAYRGHKAVRIGKRLPRIKEMIAKKLGEIQAES